MQDGKQHNDTVTLVEGYVPGCIGRIVELHGEYYSRVWGSGATFEMIVARELCDFVEGYDPAGVGDLLLTAWLGQRLAGSAVIQGRSEPEDVYARLRWFILDEAFHSRGIGRVLLTRTIEYCRERGIPGIYLWTVTDLPASLHLYESAGFRMVDRVPDDRYGQNHTHLRLELRFERALTP